MKQFLRIIALVCFGAAMALIICVATAMAQGVHYNDVARTKDNRPLRNGVVAVCVSNPTDPGNVGEPCSPLTTIYTDATLLTAAANPILADTNGNFAFWAAPGTYFLEFYSPSVATEPFTEMITLGCVPNATAAGCGSTGTSQNNTWTGTNIFGADAYFKSGDPWFDVKAFGAKCDDSTDDTAAIQAALAAVPATGGLVMIPGVCKFTSTLVINKPDVTIQGKGHFQFITQNAPVTYLDFQGTTGNAILVSAQGFKMQDVGVKYPATIGGPLPPPTLPTLTQVAGAGCPAEPYYVQVTYVNPQGETSDSAEGTITTTSGNCLQVQSPSAVAGPTGWNVYVSANPNNETKQTSVPLAIGTSWTFGGTLVNLAYRPPFNTTAYSAIYDNNGAQLEGVKLFTDAAISTGTANMANGYTSFGCCGKLNEVYVAGFGVGIAGAGANNDFSVTDSYIQSNNVGAFVVNGADINFTRDDFEGNVVGNIKMLYGSPYTLNANYFEQQGTNPPSYNVQVGDTSIPPQGFTPTPGAIFIDGNFMQCNLTAYPPAPIVIDTVASVDIEKNSFSQCGNQNIIANFAGASATIKVLGNISDAAPLAWATSTTGFVESDLNGRSLTPGTPVFFGLGVTGNLTVSTLTPGNCVQAGAGGLLTAAASACGSGNAFGGGLGASFQDVTEIAAPANPAAGNDRLFLNSTTHLLDCHTSSGASCVAAGGGGAPGGATHAVQFDNAGAFGGTSVPTANGQYSLGYNVTAGIAVDPTVTLDGVVPRDVTGTTATDTIVFGDNLNPVYYQGSVAVATALPTPTTLGNTGFSTLLVNNTSGASTAVTVTATTLTFDRTGTTTLAIAQGQQCKITADPGGTVWDTNCDDLPMIAGTSITIARGRYGPTISANATMESSDQAALFTPSGTQLLPGFGSGTAVATDAAAARVIPRPGTIGNLHVHENTGTQGASSTLQITLRTCTPSGTPLACTAASRAVTCTIASGAADCSDTTDAFTVSAGDFVDWQTVQTGASTSAIYAITFTVQ
ncbi:MAG TPA: glycosyl hydrolase family 28-related protein [Candidatus Acidoferrales bacterium]|nr:glycosyl hydrolase family 28-related protein [Candidatus Acidoferrales bacterium]